MCIRDRAKITATMSDNSKLSIDVNVNKGSFADPDNITLFGQAAGAVSVQAWITSPLTRGWVAKRCV